MHPTRLHRWRLFCAHCYNFRIVRKERGLYDTRTPPVLRNGLQDNVSKLHPLSPNVPCRPDETAWILRMWQSDPGRQSRSSLLGRAMHQRDKRKRHRIFQRMHAEMLLLSELIDQSGRLWEGPVRRRACRYFSGSPTPGGRKYQPCHGRSVCSFHSPCSEPDPGPACRSGGL